MIISKSDYIKYLQCAKLFWLYKRRKDLIPEDLEAAKAGVVAGGASVEEQAYKLFPDGVPVESRGFKEAIEETTRLVLERAPAIFQASFWADDLYCRCDILRHNPADNSWDIYEVKSATSVKSEYIADAAFQKIALRAAGLKVNRIFIVHVNKDYVRQGPVEPEKLLTAAEVTDDIAGETNKTHFAIEDMAELFREREEPQVRIVKQCREPYPCMFIPYCWRDVPEHSIYNVYLNENTINELLDRGITDLADVPAGIIVKDKYERYRRAVIEDKVRVNRRAIGRELARYRFPLYFLDYETYSPAVPLFDGYRPYQRIIFQYSLHVLRTPESEPEHFEYLDDAAGDPGPRLAAQLSRVIGGDGSVVAWFKKFEEGCNSEMGARYPEYGEFFRGVNSRLLDLMEFFAQGHYVDKNFYGSSSLKKVLPVIAPHLSYSELNITEGMAASESWPQLIGETLAMEKKNDLRSDLLAYCRLDTFALVEIFRILSRLAGNR